MFRINTIADLLRYRAEHPGPAPCIELYGCGDRDAVSSLDAEQFYKLLVHRAAFFTRQAGLRKQDTVALVADNSLEYLLCVYAAVLAGLSVFVISTKALQDHLAYFIARSGARMVIHSAAYAKQVRDALAMQPEVHGARPQLLAMEALKLNDEDLPVLRRPLAEFQHAGQIEADDTAVILHTSGTTRTPKLVYLSHRNILANQMASDHAFRDHWTARDTSLGWLPLYHGYALLAEFLRDMLAGGRYVLFPSPGQVGAQELLDAIEETGTSVLCCVPWMLRLFSDRIREEEAAGENRARTVLQRLNFIVTGGSNLGTELGDFFRQRDIRIVTMFGLSEAAGFVLHSPFDGSRWDLMLPNAASGVEFIAIDEHKREHELVITDTELFTRKVLRPPGDEETEEADRLETGDLFIFRETGWAYVGRGDQIYNGAHGEKVNPLLFEAALEQHPNVEKVFVYGEEMPFNVALVQLKPDSFSGAVTLEGIRGQIREYVTGKVNPRLENPDRVYPNDVFFLAKDKPLPLTPKGTVARKEAARMTLAVLEKKRAAVRAGGLGREGAEAVFMQELALYCPEAGSEDLAAKTLLELGFDSLMTFSFRNNLQEKLGCDIPIDLMLSYPPLSELKEGVLALNEQARDEQGPAQDEAADPEGWRRIALEQVIFHKAHYLFKRPTFGGSFSLLAPERLPAETVERGLRFLERSHEVLRSVYREDGSFRIVDSSMVGGARISHSELCGSHDLHDNPQAQKLIESFGLEHFDFDAGPTWRFATVDITNEQGLTRTLIYIGVNHIIGDFRSFSLVVREFMRYLNGEIAEDDVVPDDYRGIVQSGSAENIARLQTAVQTLLTCGFDRLRQDVDLGAGTRVSFRFSGIDLAAVTAILRRHNLSLFNTVYAVWALAASRHVDWLTPQDFPSVTSLTTRISKALETVMGSFVHTPIYRFHLDPGASMKACALQVQQTTLEAFKSVLTDPVRHFSSVVADEANLIPIIRRNVFLYRSPDESLEPVQGWDCYRNDYFSDRCSVGAYFDFCAGAEDGCMEGYLTVNLQFCSREQAELIVRDVERLMLLILERPELDFIPSRFL